MNNKPMGTGKVTTSIIAIGINPKAIGTIGWGTNGQINPSKKHSKVTLYKP